MVVISDPDTGEVTVFNHSFDYLKEDSVMVKKFLLSTGEEVSEKPRMQSRKLHLRPISVFAGRSKTQQSFKDECDINRIMKRFETTGQLPDMIKSDPRYGDFTEVPSFLDAMSIVSLAETQFAALSSKIRARFDNDPRQFLEFANDPRNAQEMVDMGLSTVTPGPTPDPVLEELKTLNKTLSTPKSDTKA